MCKQPTRPTVMASPPQTPSRSIDRACPGAPRKPNNSIRRDFSGSTVARVLNFDDEPSPLATPITSFVDSMPLDMGLLWVMEPVTDREDPRLPDGLISSDDEDEPTTPTQHRLVLTPPAPKRRRVFE